jgi:hypothetical protein
MSKYVQWVEPYGDGDEALWMMMSIADVVSVRREEEPRYTSDGKSDQQVIDDFCVIHWGTVVEWEPVVGHNVVYRSQEPEVQGIIRWLESHAANTDTDPRWLAAQELKRLLP